MIQNFRHKGLKQLFESGITSESFVLNPWI